MDGGFGGDVPELYGGVIAAGYKLGGILRGEFRNVDWSKRYLEWPCRAKKSMRTVCVRSKSAK
jgi:hypothetical protein